MKNFYIGVIMAISGNTLIAFSLTLQKHMHNVEKETGAPAASSPLFWASFAGLIVGEVGNFAAFGFASPTVVSPLGAVAVIANGVLASIVLKEQLRVRNILGMALTIFGSIVVVLNAPPSIDDLSVDDFVTLLSRTTSLVYLAILAAAVALLKMASPTYGEQYILVDLMLCSTLGSVTVLCSSAFSKFIGQFLGGDASLLWDPVCYLVVITMGITAVSQLHFLNQAMSHFESSHVVPTYYVTFTICSISGGGVVLRDFWRFTLLHALGFCIGCALCFIGVVLITYQGSVAPEVEVGKQALLSRRDLESPSDDGPASEPVTPIDRFKRSVSAIQRELGILGTLKTAAIDARLAVERNLDVVAMGTRSHSAPDVRSLLSGPAIGVAHAFPDVRRRRAGAATTPSGANNGDDSSPSRLISAVVSPARGARTAPPPLRQKDFSLL